MKKLFMFMIIAGFIACDSLTGGPDQNTNSGDYAVRAVYKSEINNRNFINFTIENISDIDLILDSIVILYTNGKTVIGDLQYEKFKSGETKFFSKMINYDAETIKYKIYQK